jgi:SMC interacting uncharacterized protein involved in chromosome segregation
MKEKFEVLERRLADDKEQLQTEMSIMNKKLRREDIETNNRIDTFNNYVQDIELRLTKLAGKDTTLEGICMALV